VTWKNSKPSQDFASRRADGFFALAKRPPPSNLRRIATASMETFNCTKVQYQVFDGCFKMLGEAASRRRKPAFCGEGGCVEV
jgi:hypothetical protein